MLRQGSESLERAASVQGLVYIFIALACLGIGGAAYFGLTFTPIEALVTALVCGAIAVMLMERTLRQRSEARIEKAIEDLSRLLSTDAQAGATLSQRVNAMADENAGKRLSGLEADISVLGTVVRQVAEALADFEETARKGDAPLRSRAEPEPDPDTFPEPVIPLEMLRQALGENRLVCHMEPVLGLPQRKAQGYDIVPRLRMEDGELADPPDFMPRSGGEDVVRQIESVALAETIVIARRARTGGQPTQLYIPLSRATLGDAPAMEQLLASLDANRAIAPSLSFLLQEPAWRALSVAERTALGNIARRGAGFSMAAAQTLRFDYGDLQGQGFRSVRVDASRFIAKPELFTDFHASDAAAYGKRYGIDIIATGVMSEPQVLTLFEDDIIMAQGPHLGAPGPVRADLLVEPALAGQQRA